MRKITIESRNAFLQNTPFSKSNMQVIVTPTKTKLLLHGNTIAINYKDKRKGLKITNAGWQSNTTKERLNALPNVSIQQKNWIWYLNGKQWNGELTKI